MAIESLDLAIRAFGTPIYVYHEIVHNKYVVDTFRAKGAVFVDRPGRSARRVRRCSSRPTASRRRFAASPASGKLRAIDATCPLVTKVHLEAIRFASEGYTILLIGHEGHDEVIGTMGEAPQAIVLVESVEDVDRLEFPPDAKLAYLTQTTLSVDDANRIIDRLKQRFPQHRRPAQGRHLLRHAEPPGSRAHARGRGRPGARAGQPEQLQQPAAEGARPRSAACRRT